MHITIIIHPNSAMVKTNMLRRKDNTMEADTRHIMDLISKATGAMHRMKRLRRSLRSISLRFLGKSRGLAVL